MTRAWLWTHREVIAFALGVLYFAAMWTAIQKIQGRKLWVR